MTALSPGRQHSNPMRTRGLPRAFAPMTTPKYRVEAIAQLRGLIKDIHVDMMDVMSEGTDTLRTAQGLHRAMLTIPEVARRVSVDFVVTTPGRFAARRERLGSVYRKVARRAGNVGSSGSTPLLTLSAWERHRASMLRRSTRSGGG